MRCSVDANLSIAVQHYPSSSHVDSIYSTPIVLLHGWGADSRIWQPLLQEIDGRFECITIDLPGFGENAELPWSDLDEFESLVVNALPTCSTLVGWSLGGMLATRIAIRYPNKVDKLITLATNPNFVANDIWPEAMANDVYQAFVDGFADNPSGTYARFLQLQAKGDRERKSIFRALQSLCGEPGEPVVVNWLQALKLLKVINNSDLASLSVPSLHVFGDNDSLVPSSAASHLQALEELAVPIAVKTLADCGHALPLSATKAIVDEIAHFVSHTNIPVSKTSRSKQSVADSFSKAATTYDSVATLQKTVADRLLQIGHSVATGNPFAGDIADVGCGTGYCGQQLQGHLPDDKTQFIGVDLSFGMLSVAQKKAAAHASPSLNKWLCGDMENLPLATHSVDNIVSSLCFQWSENLSQLFNELFRVLKPGGAVLFSTLGPRTLFELRDSWKQVDKFVHVNDFLPLDTVKQAIVESGFAIDIEQCEEQVLTYKKLITLMRELKELGAHNVNANQKPGLTSRKQILNLEKHYEGYRNKDGLLPSTYDVFYFLIRKPHG